ncbi:MAG: hypothetical protein U0441_15835 [Polyangiaceae bacterium]
MRISAALLGLSMTLALVGCDDDKKPGSGATTTAAPTAAETATAAQTATAAPSPSVSAAPIPMPPRPVPIGSSGPIQPSAPADQQMMAITYTLAMVQPRGNDPLTVDKTYLDDVTKKLEGAVRGMDKGKTPPNPVKATRGNRKIEIEMGRGCTDRIPSSIIQRAGSSLKGAYDAGVLVIACHDDKWECHQSTRDTNDVLCHAAPRH